MVLDIHRLGRRQTLDGAQETMGWTGSLPRNGDHVIFGGGTRGNATDTLEVTIR